MRTMCQGFRHFSGFLHHFVLTKFATGSMRVKVISILYCFTNIKRCQSLLARGVLIIIFSHFLNFSVAKISVQKLNEEDLDDENIPTEGFIFCVVSTCGMATFMDSLF